MNSRWLSEPCATYLSKNPTAIRRTILSLMRSRTVWFLSSVVQFPTANAAVTPHAQFNLRKPIENKGWYIMNLCSLAINIDEIRAN